MYTTHKSPLLSVKWLPTYCQAVGFNQSTEKCVYVCEKCKRKRPWKHLQGAIQLQSSVSESWYWEFPHDHTLSCTLTIFQIYTYIFLLIHQLHRSPPPRSHSRWHSAGRSRPVKQAHGEHFPPKGGNLEWHLPEILSVKPVSLPGIMSVKASE